MLHTNNTPLLHLHTFIHTYIHTYFSILPCIPQNPHAVHAITIQSAARGMLDRARLWHTVTSKSAAKAGMFIAIPGALNCLRQTFEFRLYEICNISNLWPFQSRLSGALERKPC